jgi:large subunit ribosomal protein LP2
MIEIAAFMLCKLGGKAGSADDIKAVLEAAGATANDEEIAKLVGDVEGKDLEALLAEGMEKLKDVPLGGGGGGGGGGGAAGGDGAAAEAVVEEKEEEEEMDMAGGKLYIL